MTSWTVLAAPLPEDLASPDAWALHGAADVSHAIEIDLRGYPDLMYPAPYLGAQVRADEYEDKRLLVVVPEGARPTADDVAGFARVDMPRFDNTHAAHVEIGVHPDRRRAGAGGALLAEVERIAVEQNRTTIMIWGSAPAEPPADAPGVLRPASGTGRIDGTCSGATFATRRGYTFEQAERHSVLRLPIFPDLLERMHAGAAARAGADYRLVSWTDTAPDEWVDQVAVLETRMSTDAPVAGLEVDEVPWDAARVRDKEAETAASGLGMLMVAAEHIPTGTLAAFTFVNYPRPVEEIVFQQDTLVLEEHRGRRLGMLVKTDLLRQLRDLRPGAARVNTWNAEENEHMLAINAALGFRPEGVVAAWQKRLG
jgi:GNAT superfamily N-acetyltransferase